ncbi:MAG: proton-conducting transporter membrane subunit, partial [Clostridia bacterium]
IGISMMTLLGDQNQLAIRGTILYMLNHSFVKLVLFIISGVVFMNIHKLGFNEIKGFGRKKPLLIIPFALAALSLCGFPFTLGYEAKTLIHEAILALSTSLSGFDFVLIKAVEWAFIFSGGLTAAYMLKLFFCLFIEKSEERQGFENSKKYMSKTTSVLILCCSLIFPVLGIIPHLTSDKIVSFASAFFGNSGGDKINYFAISSLYNAFISILIGVLAYIFIVRRSMIKQQQYIDFSNDRCDIEKTIYVPFFGFLIKMAGYICHFISDLPDMIILFLRKTLFSESKEKEVSPTSGSIETTATKLAKFTYERILKKDHLKLKLDIRIAIVIETLRLTTRRILRNFSFAMMMACIGISITLIYMLFLA